MRDVGVIVGGNEVASSTKFKYSGLIIQRSEDIDKDVMHRVQARWCCVCIFLCFVFCLLFSFFFFPFLQVFPLMDLIC